MLLSYFQKDQRSCPVCGAQVNSELWLIIHRLERPKIWAKCQQSRIHFFTCENGHDGVIRAPLLLYDPALPYLIYSPAPLVSDELARQDFEALVTGVEAWIPKDQREKTGGKVEVIPRDVLSVVLNEAETNVQNFAPGASIDEHLFDAYDMFRYSAPVQLPLLISKYVAQPAIAEAIRFELAMYYRQGAGSPTKMESAIQEYERCLRFYSRETFPHRWATIQSELAMAYSNRLTGERRDNLKEALRCAQKALEVFDESTFPEDYAITKSNCANIHMDTYWNYPASLELGITCYEEALKVYTPASYPEDWALVLSNMATAYMEKGNTESLQKAITHLERSLIVRTRKRSDVDWALTNMNLGSALTRVAKDLADDDFMRGVEALRSAYNTLAEKEDDFGYGMAATYNLGLALARGSDQKMLSEAIRYLQQSREAFRQNGDPAKTTDCTEVMVTCFSKWLKLDIPAEQRYDICVRAMELFENEYNSAEVGVLLDEVASHLLADKNLPKGKTLALAHKAAKHMLCIFRHKGQLKYRANGLVRLGSVYLQRPGMDHRAETSLAQKCFDEALNIVQKLEATPEVYEVMSEIQGLLLLNEEREKNSL